MTIILLCHEQLTRIKGLNYKAILNSILCHYYGEIILSKTVLYLHVNNYFLSYKQQSY